MSDITIYQSYVNKHTVEILDVAYSRCAELCEIFENALQFETSTLTIHTNVSNVSQVYYYPALSINHCFNHKSKLRFVNTVASFNGTMSFMMTDIWQMFDDCKRPTNEYTILDTVVRIKATMKILNYYYNQLRKMLQFNLFDDSLQEMKNTKIDFDYAQKIGNEIIKIMKEK